MKKIFSLFLILTVVLISVSACSDNTVADSSEKATESKQTENTDSNETNHGTDDSETVKDNNPIIPEEDIKLSEYTIVYPKYHLSMYADYIESFNNIVLENIGVKLKIEADDARESDINSKELLLGPTVREESVSATASLDGREDYLIDATGNKIVIIGHTTATTMIALKDFVETAVRPSKGEDFLKIDPAFVKKGTTTYGDHVFSNFTEMKVIQSSSVTNTRVASTGVIKYTKILPLSDGSFLATFENYGYKYDIYRSVTGGKSWYKYSTVTDSLNEGYVAEWMPHLFELPADIGEYKAGTVILAGTSKSEKDTFTTSTITLHASKDGGKTFETVCNVDIGGDIENGVWEPYLIYEEERGRLYCFYSDDGDSDHSQRLVYKYSTDLINWHGVDDKIGVDVEPKEAVACSDFDFRPGMASIADMGEGGYLMTFELGAPAGSGINDYQVFCKKTDDLDNWGDPADYGYAVKTASDSIGSAPWCAWSPVGGECGTLVVVAKHHTPWFETSDGADMFVSFDYGKTFVAIKNPIPYDLKPVETNCGYSPCVIFSKDGTTLYYINNPRNDLNNGHDVKMVAIKISE